MNQAQTGSDPSGHAPFDLKRLDGSIFKAYDIRGVVDRTLTEGAVLHIGRALGLAILRGVHEGRGAGSALSPAGRPAISLGRDGRLSGPRLANALGDGLRDVGVDVIDLGCVTTPMTYFAGFELGTGSAVMVTGSHNPPEYNGLKMVIAGETLHGRAIQGLLSTIRDGATADSQMPDHAARGRLHQEDIAARYLDRVSGNHPEALRLARPMRIAIDAGNGIAGAFAPALFRALGCEVIELFCEVDGSFPNHHPDPAHPENLQDLIRAVQSHDAELGLAFDGDGDRLGVVTRTGNIIWPDRQLILMARDVLLRRPGADIIFDVKCSRHVAHEVRAAGGVPVMNATGHSLIKARLRATGAPFAGELSGHLFFAERWYGFDDGLYAGARLLEILSGVENASEVLDAIPQDQSTPELQVKLGEGENHRFVAQLLQTAPLAGERERITIDGLRVEFEDGFGLVRASNTTPVLVCRFEGDSARALSNIQAQFAQAMRAIDPAIALPF